jgi:hypothetical protein
VENDTSTTQIFSVDCNLACEIRTTIHNVAAIQFADNIAYRCSLLLSILPSGWYLIVASLHTWPSFRYLLPKTYFASSTISTLCHSKTLAHASDGACQRLSWLAILVRDVKRIFGLFSFLFMILQGDSLDKALHGGFTWYRIHRSHRREWRPATDMLHKLSGFLPA